MINVETLLNRLLSSFEYLIENDEIFEIVVDETLWPKLVGSSLETSIVIEPKKSTWLRGMKQIPICTLNYIKAGRKPTIMLKSRKGVILSWPIS